MKKHTSVTVWSIIANIRSSRWLDGCQDDCQVTNSRVRLKGLLAHAVQIACLNGGQPMSNAQLVATVTNLPPDDHVDRLDDP